MLSTLFYRKLRLTVLVLLIIIASGFSALTSLSRNEDPSLIQRFGYIVVFLNGADASRIEAMVTEPLEAAMFELKEIKEVYSRSRQNVAQLNFNFRDDLNEAEVDDAWTLLRQKIERVRAELPANASPPVIQRQVASAETILVAIKWNNNEPPQMAILNRLAKQLESRFQNLSGTERTKLYGVASEEIRVTVAPDTLAATGMNMQQMAGLINRADSKTPAGQIRSSGTNIAIEVAGEFDSVARIRSIPLLQRSGEAVLRVGDVARVSKTPKNPPDAIAYSNDIRTVAVSAILEPGNRIDLWSDAAIGIVEDFSRTVPKGINVEIIFDQSEYAENQLNGLTKNLFLSAGLVFLVLFVVMGWRAALIVGVSLPLTICLVLILLHVSSIPLHQMSVTGLIIALGLLIDNAIVVVDEYDQKRQKGIGISEAIQQSLHHIFVPLAASTATTALAFAPIALQPGPTGEFIGAMGLSVIFAVISSFFVAITVVQACAGWFDSNRVRALRRVWWRDGIYLPQLFQGYRDSIRFCLKYPIFGILVGALPPVMGFILAFIFLPLQFFPPTERNQFQLEVTLPPEASIYRAEDIAHKAREFLNTFPEILTSHWFIGETAPRVYYNAINNVNGVPGYAGGFATTSSPEATRRIVPVIQQELRRKFPEAQFLAQPFEQGPPVGAPIEFYIIGENVHTLDNLGNVTRRILSTTPGIIYTSASLVTGMAELVIHSDEIETNQLGIGLTDLAADINAELEGIIAGSVLEDVEELPVRVISDDVRRSRLSDLRNRTLNMSANGILTPLSGLSNIELKPNIGVITRYQGQRVNTIQAFLEPYVLPAPTLADFQKRFEAADITLPAGYKIEFSGEAAERQNAVSNLAATALPLILAMFGCITLAFNSFRMSGIIFTVGGLSIGSAFFGVWLFGLPLGFTAIVGAMGLLGIAINGAIIVLSTLRADIPSCHGDKDAQCDVVYAATRHIIATTLTTIGGFSPLILFGETFWLPLATGIAGGVAGSAVLALYFTPAAFTLLHKSGKQDQIVQYRKQPAS